MPLLVLVLSAEERCWRREEGAWEVPALALLLAEEPWPLLYVVALLSEEGGREGGEGGREEGGRREGGRALKVLCDGHGYNYGKIIISTTRDPKAEI